MKIMSYCSAICLLFMISSELCLAQLRIDKDRKLSFGEGSLVELIKASNVDYALVTWSTSNWVTAPRNFSCLIQQNGKWYLAKFGTNDRQFVPKLDAVFVLEKQLADEEGAAWLKSIDPDQAFSFTQDNLNKLPETCSYTAKEGTQIRVGGVSDAGTVHLLQYKKGTFQALRYYGADFYLRRCYPYISEFGMLKGLVHSSSELRTMVSAAELR